MQWTIKRKLTGMTASGLVFVLGVSLTGYWGINSVDKTTVAIASTGTAIRNHIEAGIYNDSSRADVGAVFTQKGDEQQNKAEEFDQHSKLLVDRIAKAKELANDSASKKALAEEESMAQEYRKAGHSLVEAIVHNPSSAVTQLPPYMQLYKDLQGKIETTSDLLEKGAQDAETAANVRAAAATRAMFVMCGLSLFLSLLIALRITVSIIHGLSAFSNKFMDMASHNDLTARVDQERKDEIGELGACLNGFVGKVHDILYQISTTSHDVASASERLSASSQQISANSEETSAQ